jgi:ABC-type branched-subunit amino acid transport system ATPase component
VNALHAAGITAGYGSVPIVRDIDVRVDAGKIAVLVGPNGSGKSTLMKSVFGLVKRSAGRLELAGQDVTAWSTTSLVRMGGLAYVPQTNSVFQSLTVIENLEIGGYTKRGGALKRRIDDVLSVFPDLRSASRRRAGALSGGQRTLMALARALMVDPKVLLLDEPTSGLSPIHTGVVWDQIRRIAKLGTGVIVVEQNVDLAIDNADWVFVMVDGRNRLDGSPDHVREQPLADIFLGKNAAEARSQVPEKESHTLKSSIAPGGLSE